MIPNDLERRKKMITYMIEGCKTKEDLTTWESDFILSIEEQFEQKGNLSNRQCEILEKIYDKL
jgi:hypothetical protein